MRFLITGSAGFIGFHLARRLLADGHGVTGLDALTDYYDVRLKRARNALLLPEPGFRFVEARVEDEAALAHAAELAQPDVIVHLAAQAGVRYSIEAPRTYLESNLQGSWTVLELARRIRPRHLMLASSSSVYGAGETIPFDETSRTDEPLSLYAATKKAMEAMAHSYAHLFGVPTTAFRFFTVYGPFGRPDMALFKFVKAVIADEPIDVYGHGRMMRDFTYVDDLVEAVVRLADIPPEEGNRAPSPVADSLSPTAPYRVVNIGGGQPVSLMAFIEAVEAAVGRKARLNLLDMQPGDVPRTFADPALLHALTGYVPATGVHRGVGEFARWYRGFYGC